MHLLCASDVSTQIRNGVISKVHPFYQIIFIVDFTKNFYGFSFFIMTIDNDKKNLT